MSEKHTSWFHCGRCGSLFQSPAGDVGDRRCPQCGHNPSISREALLPALGVSRSNPSATHVGPSEPEKSSLRRAKTNHFIPLLICGWVLGLVIVVGVAKWIWQDASPTRTPLASPPPLTVIGTAEDHALLDEVIPQCNETFSSFLAAGTPEERNQFVLNPIATAARMASFYASNPLLSIDPRRFSLANRAVLQLPKRRAIETQWKSTDGQLIDAVFVEENGEWRLDWDHCARFSEHPWPLFLAGSGEMRGEFRLLARERLADERSLTAPISIVLYAPRFGYPASTGFQSPEFLIKRSSKNGRLLEAAFKQEQSGKRAFGVDIPNINPQGMIRVRVKVRRFEEDKERRFELEDVVACHWYSVDEPGVEIPDQPAEK